MKKIKYDRIPDQVAAPTDWTDSSQWHACSKNATDTYKSYYARDGENGLFAVLFQGRKGDEGHKWGAYIKIDGSEYRAKPISTVYGDSAYYLMQAMEIERLRFLLRLKSR